MTNKTASTKTAEIKMIERLMDFSGYFADSLTMDDFAKMTSNIHNDFPLFMNTSIDQDGRIASLQGLNLELEARIIRDEREMEAKDNMITCLSSDLESAREIKAGMVLQAIKADSLHLVEDFTTENEILRIKLENNLPLTEKERKALLNRI